MKVGEMETCSISSGISEFTEDRDRKTNHYNQVSKSKNRATGTILWPWRSGGLTLLCEAGKAVEKRWYFNQRSFLVRHSRSRIPAQGHVQRHRGGKQCASSGNSNQHGWNVGVMVRSGRGERLKKQQGLDSFSIQWTKFIEDLPHGMNCVRCG